MPDLNPQLDETLQPKPPPVFKPFDHGADSHVYNLNLPHWRQDGATYFVTWRQADSLPKNKLDQLQAERDMWLQAHHLKSKKEIDTLSKPKGRNFIAALLQVSTNGSTLDLGNAILNILVVQLL